MLEAVTRTSFHHQPEAQHPKSLAIHKSAGRLPHLLGVKRTLQFDRAMSASDPERNIAKLALNIREWGIVH